jgi:broad specificity phosphatase PhoE
VDGVHIFLIRHGETALNAAGVLRGQLDIPLNETGEAEARSLGEAFREVPLNAVVSSPLKRALDTALPVAAGTKAPLSIDDRLSDRFYGELAGHSLEQVEKRFGSIDAAPLVEAWQLLEARAQEAFLDAAGSLAAPDASQGDPRRNGAGTLARAATPSAALVTHDAVIRALLRLLVPALGSVRLELPTGSWSELVFDSFDGRWRAVQLGKLPADGSRP